MADTHTTERTLQREIAPAVERGLPGVEVLAVELLSPSRFCVYVDHPQGVDHALCERVTRLLDTYRADWTIDVSSPGPERPLRRREHFDRAVGSRVALRTRRPVAAKARVRGTVVAAGEREVTVRTDGGEIGIPYDEIVRANVESERDAP